MRDVNVAIIAAHYSGNKGAAAMLQSSIKQLHEIYGERLVVRLMSVYPKSDRKQVPFDFVRVVPWKAEQMVFIAFPLAILYRLFIWCAPVRKLLAKNKILKAFENTDIVIDEAGVAFVDSRGFVMNTYAFICVAIPILMKKSVVKYSQALGAFHNPWNRFLAKWILPKLKLIIARGEITRKNLEEIGITENVKVCADGAFSMPDDEATAKAVSERCEGNAFWKKKVVGLSVSSVVDKKCSKTGKDYRGTIAAFTDWLNEHGYNVMLIANAAKAHSEKTHNNDLPVGDAIFAMVKDHDRTLWYHEEMKPEEIREYIGRCECIVASRFHSMIGALEKKIPVLLVGWSHKYQEVLDMFGLGQYAADYSNLSLDGLVESFESFEKAIPEIRRSIEEHYDEVIASSRENIRLIAEETDAVLGRDVPANKKLDHNDNEKYLGQYIALRKGYSLDDEVRGHASSGGLVSGLLCNMLSHGDIDGAWVSKTDFVDGKLTTRSWMATTREEILDAGSSVYIDIPQINYLDDMEAFDGKFAVVMTPCMVRAFSAQLKKRPQLAKKVVLKIGLYCSGTPEAYATELSMKKAGITTEKAVRLFYRRGRAPARALDKRGHWRGQSVVVYEDGSEKAFSYSKYFCAYKNAYFFSHFRCMKCKDHFAECADISFGDVWLKEMKKNPIKHTSCVIRDESALRYMERTAFDGEITLSHISASDMVKSQRRALIFNNLCVPENENRRWNYKMAWKLAESNRRYSAEHPEKVAKIPSNIVYLYMCFIRFLISI